MDAVTELGVKKIVWMAPTQVGKTEVELNILGFHIAHDPCPILGLWPTVGAAERMSKERVQPMIDATPSISQTTARKKSRDSGNTILHKEFKGGSFTAVGANSPVGLAMIAVRVALIDEPDRYPFSAGREGSPTKLLENRQATYWNRLTVEIGSPTITGKSAIASSYEDSDQRIYEVPCPHCGTFQEIKWENIKWKGGRDIMKMRDTIGLQCAAKGCGKMIDQSQQLHIVREGRWRATKPFSGVAGFASSCLISSWRTWAECADAMIRARGNPEDMKVWTNTYLAQTWDEERTVPLPLPEYLYRNRREPYAAQVPEPVRWLQATVDTQDSYLDALVVGWGEGEEAWSIDRRIFEGDPGAYPVTDARSVFARCLEFLLQPYEHESGAILQISRALIDSGGHHTDSVYSWVLQHPYLLNACHGSNQRDDPIIQRASKVNAAGVRPVRVGVSTGKDLLFARLQMPEPGPGYMHFSDDEQIHDEEYFRQLLSEKRVRKWVRGEESFVYEAMRDRNEVLDQWVYQLAGLRLHRPRLSQLHGVVDEDARREQETRDAQQRLAPPPNAIASQRWLQRGTRRR